MIVYLCGPINGCSDEEAMMWRQMARERLAQHGHDVLDPMRSDYRGAEVGREAQIVASDIQDINAADAVLAMARRPSWGTAMEIHYAHRAGKLVAAVVDEGPLSPWLTYHTSGRAFTLFGAIDTLLHSAPRDAAKGEG